MSLPPLEGSRDTGKGIIVSIYPDVCLAKKDPVPFSIYAIQGEDANTAASVRMTGQRAHNMASLTTCCHGDEPGVAGVKSGTVLSICEPKTHSATVRIEGKHAIRHKDEWWMNNRNTVGKLSWVEDTDVEYPTPPILLAQADTGTMNDAGLFSGEKTKKFDIEKVGRKLKPHSSKIKSGNLAVEAADFLTGGLVTQRRIENQINTLQAILDAPTTPPFTDAQRQILQQAITDINDIDLPAGDLEGAEARADKARDQVFAAEKATAGITSETLRVTGDENPCDELCKLACQCMNDRGGARTYQQCVAQKLRDKYYDLKNPRRPNSPTADGPRPEVSYDPKNGYSPVGSLNEPGMPTSRIPVPGAPRPDVSWWKGGKLWKLFEMKFPTASGGVNGMTPMQEAGEYNEIAKANGLNPKTDIIDIDVKKDCECNNGGGKAKTGAC